MYKPRKKINESANIVIYNEHKLTYNDNDAIPFGINTRNNKIYVGKYGTQHYEMYPLEHQKGLTKSEGRFWVNSKIISFYTPYPEYEFLLNYLDKIE